MKKFVAVLAFTVGVSTAALAQHASAPPASNSPHASRTVPGITWTVHRLKG